MITKIYSYRVTCNSCNMGMRDLPDMFAKAIEPQAQGHTYQANHECTCYKCYATHSLP